MFIGQVGRIMGTVYILRCGNDRFYIGSTIDLEERLRQHSAGKVKSTCKVLPVELVFHQRYPSAADARKIEYRLKKLKSRKIIENIVREQRIRMQP